MPKFSPISAQRKVIVVILAQHFALFLGEHLTVKVQQIAHFQIFLPSSDPPVLCLYFREVM